MILIKYENGRVQAEGDIFLVLTEVVAIIDQLYNEILPKIFPADKVDEIIAEIGREIFPADKIDEIIAEIGRLAVMSEEEVRKYRDELVLKMLEKNEKHPI